MPPPTELDVLRDDIRRTSLGGFPMLLTAALAWAVCSALTYCLPARTVALIFFFQGIVVMPLGLWLFPRLLKLPAMPRDHVLTPLLIQCASVQTLMLPAVIAVFSLKPSLVPMAFAAVTGAHFLPYWWLQRSKAYLWGSIAVAIGPWMLTFFGGIDRSFHYTGFYVAAVLVALAFVARKQVLRGETS